MSNLQVLSVRYLLFAILDAVDAAESMGAPSGIIYAGLSGRITLSQYQDLMQNIVNLDLLIQEGDLFTLTEVGREQLANMKQFFST